jgi:hypothetical protein
VKIDVDVILVRVVDIDLNDREIGRAADLVGHAGGLEPGEKPLEIAAADGEMLDLGAIAAGSSATSTRWTMGLPAQYIQAPPNEKPGRGPVVMPRTSLYQATIAAKRLVRTLTWSSDCSGTRGFLPVALSDPP